MKAEARTLHGASIRHGLINVDSSAEVTQVVASSFPHQAGGASDATRDAYNSFQGVVWVEQTKSRSKLLGEEGRCAG